MSGMFYLLNYKPKKNRENKMRQIGFGQLLVLLVLCFLLFGDLNKLKTKLVESGSTVFSLLSKNFRKKGS